MILRGFKEGQRGKHLSSTLLDYCRVEVISTQKLEINYDRYRHGGIDYSSLKQIISKYGDGASVCTDLSYIVRNPGIDVWMFDRKTGKPLRKKKYTEPVVTVWEPFTIHSKSSERELEFIKELKRINQKEIDKRGFKLGTLDLVKVVPLSDWGSKRKHYLDATKLSREEIIKLQEPLATDLKSRRLYRMAKGEKWKLVSW